jgi:hypothetical protein
MRMSVIGIIAKEWPQEFWLGEVDESNLEPDTFAREIRA